MRDCGMNPANRGDCESFEIIQKAKWREERRILPSGSDIFPAIQEFIDSEMARH
jgi:hypothetical protein